MNTSSYITLGGGMDLVTPPRQLAPGRALYALNYECPVTGGFRRVDGYTQVGPEVPGEGPLLGVCTFIDDTYAIRKDAGAETATLFRFNTDTEAWDTVGTGGELANGRHEFAEGNFLATAAGRALYMVGGGKPFELKDGTLTELTNGPDGGAFIAVHRNHLFVALPEGSLQHSALGDPADWTTSNGAGEIGMQQAITGILVGRGGVLHIGCRNDVKTLYGSSSADWELRTTIPDSGPRAYSLQTMTMPYYVTERGISTLDTSDRFGDFAPMQAAPTIEPTFTDQGKADSVVASCVSKTKAQYRVFFNDKTGVYLSPQGATFIEFPDQIAVASSGERDSGEEVILFGDDQGAVHRLDDGDSFNSTEIPAFLTLAFTDLKSPNIRKRFRRAFFDITNNEQADVSVRPVFDYGGIEAAEHRKFVLEFMAAGGLWSIAQWDGFVWSSPIMSAQPIDIAGTASSIGFAFYSSTSEPGHTILGYQIIYSARRQQRG